MPINQLTGLKWSTAPTPNINNKAKPTHHKKVLSANNTPPLSGTTGAVAGVNVVSGVGDCTTMVLVAVTSTGSVAWGSIEVAVGAATGSSVEGIGVA